MDIVELFKNSLFYPTQDLGKVVLFGVLFVVMSILAILEAFGLGLRDYLGATVVTIISSILFIIITLIILGYSLNITRKTIKNVDGEIPELDLLKNFIDGIKVAILTIVYYIIPVLVLLVVGFLTGAFVNVLQLVSYAATGGAGAIPQTLLSNLGASFLITFLIAGIFFIIFELLLTIARAVLAETESLAAAINIPAVFEKIGEIGWGNYIVWIVVFLILVLILGFISGFIGVIPFIGLIIVSLVVKPYIDMFSSRALGLIYNESKK